MKITDILYREQYPLLGSCESIEEAREYALRQIKDSKVLNVLDVYHNTLLKVLERKILYAKKT